MGSEIDSFSIAASTREKLTAAFPGQVTGPDDAGFEDEVCYSWSVTSRTPAAAYVRLRNAKEVAKALSIVQTTGCKFAIRCAGHNANPGFSSVDSNGVGVILDLRELKAKSLDKESNTVHVGAGNNWSEVFTWLEGENISVIGAREGRVGLSGFLIGGGQGIFSSSHGLGADGVKNFEVVLASGAIVNANADSHPDLYLALKGGGSNFGIVTAVSLYALPLIKVQYTINMYDPADYQNVIHAFAQVQIAMEKDPKIGLFINVRRDFIAIGLFYAEWPVDFPSAFDPFVELKSLLAAAVPTSNGTFSTLNTILEEWAYKEKDLKHAYLTMTTKVSYELYEEIHCCWKEVVEQLPRTADLHWTIQPLSQAAVTAGKERGGNILGLEDVSQSCWIFTCDWKDNEEDEAVNTSLELLLQRAERIAKNNNILLDLRFPTFAGATQNALGSFGAENLKKLWEVASKYDSDRVFQRLQNGGFLLRNVRGKEF